LLLYKPGTETPFRKIKKLLPGHYLEINAATGSAGEQKCYYQVPFDGKYNTALSEREWMGQTEKLLVKAVTDQLLSDAPVGFFLSGGLDSSLITAIARKHRPDLPLHGFTINTGGQFRKEGFADDLPYAWKAAAHTGCSLEVVPGAIDIVREFDKMIWHLDEPQADPAALYVYHIARAARERGIKVLLSGAGADDVFSGYRRHQALRWMPAIRKMPPLLQKGLLGSVNMLGGNAASRRLNKLFANSRSSELSLRISSFFWMQPHDVSALFRPDISADLSAANAYSYFEALTGSIPMEKNHLNQMLFWEMRTFLPDHNLNYTDKMSMAAGVEARVPYLDRDLVDLSTAMPPGLKMKHGETKYILRQVARAYLPKQIIYRKKTGFGAPVRTWIGREMKMMVEDRLLSGNLEHMNIFSPEAIRQLAADTHSGKRDGAYTLFSLLAIESWLRQFTS
jgi:asparagine synthase (glutamine-hydrolysing)